MGEPKGIFWGLLLVSAVIIVSFLAQYSEAAGLVMVEENDTFVPARVLTEFAVINYQQEWVNLGLVVTIAPSAKGFWIIPVPTSGFKTQPLDQLPFFEGKELRSFAEERLNHIYEGTLAPQIYPLPLTSSLHDYYSPYSWVKKEKNSTKSGVVYALGMQNDVIPPGKLEEYFMIRNVKLNVSTLFEKYETANYSYAIVWFARINTTVSRGIWLSFPSKEPYYPIELSKQYSEKYPFEIYFTRHATTDWNDENGFYKIEHLYQPGYTPELPVLFYGNKTKRDLEYTKVTLESSQFDGDIKFVNLGKEEVAYTQSIVKHPFLWGFLAYLLVSMFASMISGAIIFWGSRPHLLQFFVFGLNNFLTLPGFWTRSYLKGVDEEFTDLESKINQRIELTKVQRFFLLAPAVILLVLLALIPVTLFLELGPIVNPLFLSNLFLYWLIPGLVFFILILWGVFQQQRVLLFNIVFTITFLMMLFLSYVGMRSFI